MTTLTTLIARVRNRVNLPAGDARVTDADITDFINSAMHDADEEFDWPWMEAIEQINVTAGDNTYPVSNYKGTTSLTLVDPPSVLYRRTWKWLQRLNTLEVEGPPRYYTEDIDVIYIYPYPDRAYLIDHRYKTTLTELATGTDEVESPDWFDRAIVSKASSYVAQKLRDSEHYQMFEKSYKDQIETAMDRVSRNFEPVIPNVRHDWWI